MQVALSDAKTGQAVTTPIFDHHLLIVGQTGSGKTTTALSILNQLQQTDQTAIVLDPTGEYSRLPHAVTYCLGENAYLEAGKLTADQFQEVLGCQLSPGLHQRLSQAIAALKIQRNLRHQPGPLRKLNQPIAAYQELLGQLSGWSSDYAVNDLPQQLVEEAVVPFADSRADYSLLGQEYDYGWIRSHWDVMTAFRERLASRAFRQLFDTVAHPGQAKTELGFVLKMFLNQRATHRTLVIDLSLLKGFEHEQGAIISYLLKLILNDRLAAGGSQLPVKIVLDEAHRYLPTDQAGLSYNGIFQLLREGRKVNLQLALTTQSPLDLPARLRSQFSTLVIHRLLSAEELASLSTTLIPATVATLPTGEAYLLQPKTPARLVKVLAPQWY